MTDDRQIAALEKSIEHWKENLKLAKLGILTHYSISGNACPLCKVNEDNCFQCVLAINGHMCVGDENLSAWGKVAEAFDEYEVASCSSDLDKRLKAKRKLIGAIRNMIKVLEEVLKEETK